MTADPPGRIDRVANGIAVGLIASCSIAAAVGVVGEWLIGPWWAAAALTLLALAVGAFLVLCEIASRR